MKTRITDLLQIQYPIIQAAAHYVGVPELVAAVSNAGGLGILATGRLTPKEMRDDIRAVRQLTDKPFGVSVLPTVPGYEKLARVIIDERVPVVSHGYGNPKWVIDATKEHGTIVMPTIGALKHAIRAEKDGAKALVVQGMEGGGHASSVSTIVLLPLVADAVRIPVVAAGGFCDGRGLLAALALGADGIYMGTRFAMSQESPLASTIKERFINATENDTVVTEAVDGKAMRVIRNKLIDMFESGGHKSSRIQRFSSAMQVRKILGVSWWQFIVGGLKMKRAHQESLSDLQKRAAGAVLSRRALAEGDPDLGAIPSGQVCGRIDNMPSAEEIINKIVSEATMIMEALLEKGEQSDVRICNGAS